MIACGCSTALCGYGIHIPIISQHNIVIAFRTFPSHITVNDISEDKLHIALHWITKPTAAASVDRYIISSL